MTVLIGVNLILLSSTYIFLNNSKLSSKLKQKNKQKFKSKSANSVSMKNLIAKKEKQIQKQNKKQQKQMLKHQINEVKNKNTDNQTFEEQSSISGEFKKEMENFFIRYPKSAFWENKIKQEKEEQQKKSEDMLNK